MVTKSHKLSSFTNDRIPEVPPRIKPLPATISRTLWSVMIPCYNCIDYIREVLESVLIQDEGPEIMQIEVVDDCSTDGDVETLVKTVGKGRVQYFRQEKNRGSLRNFETCINRARGKYVHILHGDDKIEAGFYGEILALFTSYPEAGAALTNFTFIDHLSQKIDIVNEPLINEAGIIPDFLYQIAHRQLVQPPAIVVKRSVYEDLGSFYAVHFGEDWEMWTRIATKYPVAFVPKYLASYRVAHGIGISHNHTLTGENVTDIKKVIDIIQTYLPQEKRITYKKASLSHYAVYCIRNANRLLLINKEAAFRQVKGAWEMSKSPSVSFWMIRFYLLYIFRLKEIKNFSKKLIKNTKSL